MKKFLLSMTLVAAGLSMATAKDYVIFGEGAPETTWAATEDGFTATTTVDGESFTLTTVKAGYSSNLVEPGDQIRVYKNSEFTITAANLNMKQIVLTATETKYYSEETISDGWSQSSEGLNLTLTSDGLKNMTMTASNKQFRISKIVVSDEAGGTTTPDDPVVPEVVVANSVAETIALASDTQITVNYPLTVAFVNNRNIFAADNAGNFIQVYGDNSYSVNDVIPTGWMGTYKLYNGNTPEIIPEGALPAATEQSAFVPKTVAAADINTSLVNNVILISNVNFAEATPDSKTNFTGVANGVELSFRNNYTLASVPAGNYDVTVVVTIYQNAPSLYVVNYASAGSGVEGVEVENNAVKYYNLQGVRIENPDKGVYIRVQGNKATKVAF